jgi:hypothetical protein
MRFQLESDNPAKHTARLHLTGLKPGRYTVRDDRGASVATEIKDGAETTLELAMDSGGVKSFTVQRSGAVASR